MCSISLLLYLTHLIGPLLAFSHVAPKSSLFHQILASLIFLEAFLSWGMQAVGAELFLFKYPPEWPKKCFLASPQGLDLYYTHIYEIKHEINGPGDLLLCKAFIKNQLWVVHTAAVPTGHLKGEGVQLCPWAELGLPSSQRS